MISYRKVSECVWPSLLFGCGSLFLVLLWVAGMFSVHEPLKVIS